MPTQTDYTNDAQGRAKLTLTVNATTTGANWSASVSDGSTNYGGWANSSGSWSVTVGGQSVASASGKSYDFGSGVVASPYFPRSASGSVTLSPGTYTASATFSGDGSTVGTASVSFSFTVTAPPATTYYYVFNANGGSGSFSNSSTTSTSITAPDPGTRSGFTFLGWYYPDYSQSYGPYSIGSSIPVTGLSTTSGTYTNIVAFWQQSGGGPTTYSYSYNSDGGSNTPSGATVNAGTGITLGSPGTRSGYTFTGWYSSATGQTLGSGASYTVNASTTFTAQWTLDGGGATYPPAWTDNALGAFIAGKAYSDAVVASNMNYSGVYSVSAGSLPSGISLNTSTGALTGTVTSATDYSFTITATNSYSSVQQAFSGSITGALSVYSEGQWTKKVARVYDSGEWKPATVNIFFNNSWSPAS
jgi:uncharacterized repeat protein (TIGR02543 family)